MTRFDIAFWTFSACVGFLSGGTPFSTVLGLTVGLGFSLFATVVLEVVKAK